MILFSVILLVTFFCLHKDDNDGMEKTRLLPIRGILCVLIVLHHIYREFPDIFPRIFFIYNNVGFWIVSLFFFFSGYGLAVSNDKKVRYLSIHFIKGKIQKILFPSLAIFIIYILVYSFAGEFTFKNWWLLASNGQCIPSSHWFVYVLFIQYFLFFLCYRLNSQYSFYFYILSTLILMLFLYIIDFPSIWYKSTIFMPLGILYYERKNHGALKKIVLVVVVLICMIVYGLYTHDIILYKAFGNIFLSVAIIAMFLFFSKRYVVKSKLWNLFGKNSMYIYMFHQPVLDSFKGFMVDSNLYFIEGATILVVIISLALAFLFNRVQVKNYIKSV